MAADLTDPKIPDDLFDAPLSDGKLTDHYWECFDASYEKFQPLKKHGATMFRTYAGKLLNKRERDWLTETERPPVELNLVTQKVNTILGTHMADRKEVQFKPDADDPDEVGDVLGGWMTQLVRKAMNNCEGHRQQSDSFLDDLCAGYGYAEVYLDVARLPFAGVLKAVNFGEVWDDPEATEDCLTDRTFIIREKEWLLEQVYARWPDKKKEIRDAATKWQTFIPRRSGGRRNTQVASDSLRGRVKVAEFQYKRWVSRVRWYDPETEQRRDTTPDVLKARQAELKKVLDPNGRPMYEAIVEQPYLGETWYRGYLLLGGPGAQGNKKGKNDGTRDAVVLEHAESPRKGPTILCATCMKDKDPEKKQMTSFGPVQILHGLQMVLNRFVQEHLAILARSVKGGGDYAPEAIPDSMTPEQWIKARSKPGAWAPVSQEAWDFIRHNPNPMEPTGITQIEEQLITWMSTSTGLSEILAGSDAPDRSSAKLVNNLQQQSVVSMGPVLDPFTLFIKQCGQAMAEILLTHLPEEDINKLLGNPQVEGITAQRNQQTGELEPLTMDGEVDPATGQAAQIPVTAGYLLKQENPIDYKVSVDVGNVQVSLKYAIWELFEQGILQTIQNAAPDSMSRVIPMLFKNLPLPGAEAKELADGVRQDMEAAQRNQTIQGIQQTLMGMDPSQVMPMLQQVAQQMMAEMQQQQQVQGPAEEQAEGGTGSPAEEQSEGEPQQQPPAPPAPNPMMPGGMPS